MITFLGIASVIFIVVGLRLGKVKKRNYTPANMQSAPGKVRPISPNQREHFKEKDKATLPEEYK